MILSRSHNLCLRIAVTITLFPLFNAMGDDRVKNSRIELGIRGESMAVNYLQKQGYKILQRNFRCRHGEIDIICSREHTIIFVEVKTRISTNFGTPEESITRTKQHHIHKAALAYLETCNQPFPEIRFDVIGILCDDGQYHINHLPAAF